MSLLRRTRTEVAGAWRSVRYDLGRRPVEPPAGGPDVTSTGMSTFGGAGLDLGAEAAAGARHGAPATVRPRRRAVAVTALGVLTVLAATGAYLGVVNGLGSLLHERPAAADTFPPAPGATATLTPNAGIGAGPPGTRPVVGATAAADAAAAVPAASAVTAPPPAPGNTSPVRTIKPTNPECAIWAHGGSAPGSGAGAKGGSGAGMQGYGACPKPPVPTPTAPTAAPSPTATPDESDAPGSPSPTASATVVPDPSETSATPDDSAEPSDSPRDRHRRRHR
jgi:hypothetical protein